MMRLKDQIAVVTGGGSGIGQAIATLFAQEGATIVVADRIEARAQTTVDVIQKAGGVGLAVAVDVAQKSAVNHLATQALEHYGRVDILVNNAAIAEGDDILTFDEETWELNL